VPHLSESLLIGIERWRFVESHVNEFVRFVICRFRIDRKRFSASGGNIVVHLAGAAHATPGVGGHQIGGCLTLNKLPVETNTSPQFLARALHDVADVARQAIVEGRRLGRDLGVRYIDYVVAAADARFSTPFVALGLTPEAASSLIAPRLMGHANAFSLLVMGRSLDAGEAKALGIVNMVVSAAEVEAEAMKAAREISDLPPAGVLASRRLLRGTREEIIARIDEEAEEFKVRLTSLEARTAFTGFLTRKR
jgi:hypothetical protein